MTAILTTRPATYSATSATSTTSTTSGTARKTSIKSLLTTAKTTPVVLSAVRVIVSFLWICHGLQGLIGAFGGIDGHGMAVPPSMVEGYSASLIETFVGALVLIGLATRIAAVLCSGVMAFAYFTVHIHLGLFPIANQGEEAVLYCWVFLLIAFAGPGKFAVDTLIRRARARR